MKYIKNTLATLCCLFVLSLSYNALAVVLHQHPLPTIITTDMGDDDWLALLYLFNQPNVYIAGIIVDNNGSASCQKPHYYGAANADKIIHLANPKVRVPIICNPTANQKPYAYPTFFRQKIDQMFDIRLTRGKNPINYQQTPEAFIAKLIQRYGNIQVLSIGTASTLAQFIQHYPVMSHHIKQVVMMGGAIYVKGNLTPFINIANQHAEWNIYPDVMAFQHLLNSHIPLTLVPLDVTNTLPVSIYDVLLRPATTTKQQFVRRVLQANLAYIKVDHLYYWDPLTAFVFVHPEAVQASKRLKLCVVTQKNQQDYGRVYVCKQGSAAKVVFAVDNTAFKQDFYQSLNRD